MQHIAIVMSRATDQTRIQSACKHCDSHLLQCISEVALGNSGVGGCGGCLCFWWPDRFPLPLPFPVVVDAWLWEPVDLTSSSSSSLIVTAADSGTVVYICGGWLTSLKQSSHFINSLPLLTLNAFVNAPSYIAAPTSI